MPKLKERMLKAGLSQVSVAQRLGVRESVVSNVLSGRCASKRIVDTIEQMLLEKEAETLSAPQSNHI